MSFVEAVHAHFVPSKGNAYRPYLLRKQWLLFFVAVIFVSEGLFTTSLFAGQGSDAVASEQVASVSAAPGVNSFLQNVGRQLVRFAVESKPGVPWALGGVFTLVALALLLTFFMHIQIQHSEMLFSGSLVAMFALTLLITNAQIAGMM